jgi:GNAT superfamily N-acetyltransferase
MEIHVERATTAHLPRILERWAELMQAHQAVDEALFATAVHAPGTYQAFVRQQMDKRSGLVLVAPAPDGDLRGYLLGGVGQRGPTFALRDVGMVFDLVVRPADRRHGVARALVQAAMATFRARGLDLMQVNFAPDNPEAAGFWTNFGFRPLLCEAYLALDEAP